MAFFLLASVGSVAQLTPFGIWKRVFAPVNPTSLSLTHTSNNQGFSVSWTAGAFNGGAGGCKLQYLRNGTTWTDFGGAYDCDSNTTNASASLPVSGAWTNNFNSSGVSIRLARVSDSSPVGSFSQTVKCSPVGGSGSPTPSYDEDCDGNWDNSSTTTDSSSCQGVNAVPYNGGEVPGNPYTCPAINASNYCTGKNVTGFLFLQCEDPIQWFSDLTCTTFSFWGSRSANPQFAISGTIPRYDLWGRDILDTSCQSAGNSVHSLRSSGGYWHWGCHCYYQYTFPVTIYY